MEISVSLWSYVGLIESGKCSVCDAIRHMHSCNVKYVEVLDFFLPTDEKKKEVKELIDSLGMKVSSYSVSNDFVCDEQTRQNQVAMLKEACKYAHYFQTNTIRVFAGNVKDGYDFDKAFELIVASFKECVLEAEKENVYYCLENHGLLAGKSKQVLSIIDAVNNPHLKATTDTGNFMLVGENSCASVHNLKGKIGLVHFKDFKKVEKDVAKYKGLADIYVDGVVIGEGDVHIAEVVKQLKEDGYNGCLSIEYEGTNSFATVEKSIQNALAFIKE